MLEIDRQLLLLLNGSDSVFFDKLMMALTSGFTWIPLYLALLYVVVKNNETTAQILLIIGCAVLCIVLADGVADFLAKPYFQRWRPSNDPMIKYAVKAFCKTGNIKDRMVLLSGVVAIIGVLVHGFADTVYFRPQIQLIYWSWVAAIYVYSDIEEKIN